MQYEAWKKEYNKASTLIPTTKRTRPSSALLMFEQHLEENKLKMAGPILDLGCGNGRNSIYFSEKGYKVYALDFIESVLERLKERTRGNKNIKVITHALPAPLPFKENSVGLVLDLTTTISLDQKELVKAKKEIYRVLKPSGYFVCYYIADKESYHEKLITHPDQKFVTMPNGVRDRIWNIPAVVKFYDCFEPKLLYNKHKKDMIGKKLEPLNMIFGVFRKPILI